MQMIHWRRNGRLGKFWIKEHDRILSYWGVLLQSFQWPMWTSHTDSVCVHACGCSCSQTSNFSARDSFSCIAMEHASQSRFWSCKHWTVSPQDLGIRVVLEEEFWWARHLKIPGPLCILHQAASAEWIMWDRMSHFSTFWLSVHVRQ